MLLLLLVGVPSGISFWVLSGTCSHTSLPPQARTWHPLTLAHRKRTCLTLHSLPPKVPSHSPAPHPHPHPHPHTHTPTLTPPVAPPPAAPPRCLLVFNNASLPSSFPDPLFDSFLVNSINHHQRLSKPTTRSLSSLLTSPNSLRKSSSTPVTRFFYWCFGFSTTPSSFQPTIPFPQYLGVFSRFPLWIVNKGTIALCKDQSTDKDKNHAKTHTPAPNLTCQTDCRLVSK